MKNSNINYVLAIDPGIYTIGVVAWEETKFRTKQLTLPTANYSYDLPKNIRKKINIHKSSFVVATLISNFINGRNISTIMIEQPQVFGLGTVKEVMQMEFMRGILYGMCRFAEWVDVPVSKWKGQMSKEMVCQRIATLYGLHDLNICKQMSTNYSHDWDALGIGLFVQGLF